MSNSNSRVAALFMISLTVAASMPAAASTCGGQSIARTPNDFRRQLIGLKSDVRALQDIARDRSTGALGVSISAVKQSADAMISYRDKVPPAQCDNFTLTAHELQESVRRLSAAASEAQWEGVVKEGDQTLRVLAEIDYLPRRWTKTPRMGGSYHNGAR